MTHTPEDYVLKPPTKEDLESKVRVLARLSVEEGMDALDAYDLAEEEVFGEIRTD